MKTAFNLFVIFMILATGAIAGDDPLEYRDRGGYFEGYHSQPVSSGRDYRVVSFRVWTESIEDDLDGNLTLGFHVDDISRAHPVIQLCDQESHYLLNKVVLQENPGEKISSPESDYFEFTWASSPVLKQTIEQPNLRELAAVVRLDSPEAKSVQHLAPVLLSNGAESVEVEYYVLDLYVADTVNVTCTLLKKDGTPVSCPELEKIKKIDGDTYAMPIKFSTRSLEDEKHYILNIVGSFASEPAKTISQQVFFQHRENWVAREKGDG